MDGQSITTESGEKICIGNHAFDVGESVWVDGRYAFGNDRRATAPVVHEMGTATVGDYFIWCGFNDDNKAILRVYDKSVKNHIDVELKIPGLSKDDIQFSLNFCYNKTGTKYGFLLFKSGTLVMRVLDSDGWHNYDTPCGDDIANTDCYFDSENAFVCRIFCMGISNKNFDIDSSSYITYNADSYFKYFKDGQLQNTSTLSGTVLADYSDSLLTKLLDVGTSKDLTLKGKEYDSDNAVDITTPNHWMITNNTDAAAIYHTLLSGVSEPHKTMAYDEFTRHCPRFSTSVTLLNWTNEKIGVGISAKAPVWIQRYHLVDSINMMFSTPTTVLTGESVNNEFFAVAAIMSMTLTESAYVENCSGNFNTLTRKTYDTIFEPTVKSTYYSWSKPPTDTNYWMMVLFTTIHYFLGLYNIPDIKNIFNDDSNSVDLGDGYEFNDYNLLKDTSGWQYDTKKNDNPASGQILPLLTVLDSKKIILAGYLINKEDNSSTHLFSYSYNTRMPLISNMGMAGIVSILSQT